MKESERFYRFGDNSALAKDFAWGASIRARSEVIHRVCPQDGAVEEHPSGAFDVVVEGGSKYPDVLGCGPYPFLVVSERVITAWRVAKVSCFHTYSVGIAEVHSDQLLNVSPPRYFRVEIDGRCQIDLAAGGIEVIHFSPESHHLVTRPSLVSGFNMVSGSWDGCDLFRDPVLYPRVNFCTQVVLELAREHRLTNFRFVPMEGPPMWGSGGIEYLK